MSFATDGASEVSFCSSMGIVVSQVNRKPARTDACSELLLEEMEIGEDKKPEHWDSGTGRRTRRCKIKILTFNLQS